MAKRGNSNSRKGKRGTLPEPANDGQTRSERMRRLGRPGGKAKKTRGPLHSDVSLRPAPRRARRKRKNIKEEEEGARIFLRNRTKE